jgi:hypothetical protein|tara:strand:- start:10094 stop:11209 length:1116 start_codon:yes stop_codon:yes gene_type:complete
MEPKRKTLGQKVVDFLPSQHKDPKRKAEQERGLQELVDFFVPQTKTDIALSVLPIGFIGKHGKKGLKDAVEAFDKYKRSGGMDHAKFKADKLSGQLTADMRSEFYEMKEYLTDWIRTYRGTRMNPYERMPNVLKPTGNKKRLDVDNFQAVNEDLLKPVQLYFDDLKINDKSITLGQYRHEFENNISSKVFANRKVFYDSHLTESISEAIKRSPTDLRRANYLHELVHALTFGERLLHKDMRTIIEKAKFESIEELGAMVMPGAPFKRMLSGRIAPISKKTHEYLASPSEIFARIFELRYDLGETATNLTRQKVRLKTDLFQENKPYTELRAVLSHKQIENLYNNLPAMLPLGMFGKGQFENANKKINDKDK